MTAPLHDICQAIGRRAQAIAERLGRPLQIMEICGTHTVSISRSGLRSMLGDSLRLVSGPGCPVCVTDQGWIDMVIDLALARPDIMLATYGDMIRVPGRAGSLAAARAQGADVRVVYSAHQAMELARRTPARPVVFLGIGFETTTPATALAVRQAQERSLSNFSVLTSHKLVLPAMKALLQDPDLKIDAFLCPGHVSVILGWRAYEPIVQAHRRPCVVAGFEAPNITAALWEILEQLEQDRPAAANVYPAVLPEGNRTAQTLLQEAFEVCDARWRGVGVIPGSGLRLAGPLRRYDAQVRFDVSEQESPDPPGCRCGEVITGKILPTACALFGRVCTPNTPVGPCMVSSEGSCSAYFQYRTGRQESGKGART